MSNDSKKLEGNIGPYLEKISLDHKRAMAKHFFEKTWIPDNSIVSLSFMSIEKLRRDVGPRETTIQHPCKADCWACAISLAIPA